MAILDIFRKQTEEPKSIGESIVEALNMKNIELPKPKEQKGFDWVLFGMNNQFPIDLLEYRNSSLLPEAMREASIQLISTILVLSIE